MGGRRSGRDLAPGDHPAQRQACVLMGVPSVGDDCARRRHQYLRASVSPRTRCQSWPPMGGSSATRLPVPVVHKRHGIQPDRDVAGTDLGEMTMMVEAVISLTTAILVIARAVNVLPG